jgi:cell shape-determining protein MreD
LPIRNETLFKWTLYGAAAVLCFTVQAMLLQRITVFGVIPFIYPLPAVILATYEGPKAGTVFALVMGVVTDLLLPAPIPCLYTLVFPLAGLFSALLAQGVLHSGYLCSLVGTALAFVLTDSLSCLLLWIGGSPAWLTGLSVFLRETCVSLPVAFPVTALFAAAHRRVHFYD